MLLCCVSKFMFTSNTVMTCLWRTSLAALMNGTRWGASAVFLTKSVLHQPPMLSISIPVALLFSTSTEHYTAIISDRRLEHNANESKNTSWTLWKLRVEWAVLKISRKKRREMTTKRISGTIPKMGSLERPEGYENPERRRRRGRWAQKPQ